jgi:hypothetical protein
VVVLLITTTLIHLVAPNEACGSDPLWGFIPSRKTIRLAVITLTIRFYLQLVQIFGFRSLHSARRAGAPSALPREPFTICRRFWPATSLLAESLVSQDPGRDRDGFEHDPT